MSKDSLSTKSPKKKSSNNAASKTEQITSPAPKNINIPAVIASLLTGAGVFFGSQIFAALLVVVGLLVMGNKQDQIELILSENRFAQLVLVAFVGLVVINILYRILKWRKEKPLKFMLLAKRPTLSQAGEVVLTYGLYFLVLIVGTIILSIFTGVDIDQAQDLGIASPEDFSSKVTVFLMLAVVPPIYEEILFRGFLYNMLRKYSSQIISVILTSVLFGVAHLEYGNLNWIAAFDTMVFSVFLIYISQKHQSLYSAMLLHAIKNGVAFYVLFVRV